MNIVGTQRCSTPSALHRIAQGREAHPGTRSRTFVRQPQRGCIAIKSEIRCCSRELLYKSRFGLGHSMKPFQGLGPKLAIPTQGAPLRGDPGLYDSTPLGLNYQPSKKLGKTMGLLGGI